MTTIKDHSQGALPASLLVLLVSAGCGTNLSSESNVFYNVGVPDGSLRVGEVAYVVTQQNLQKMEFDKDLMAAGISAGSIREGRVVKVNVFCCNHPYDMGLFVYVPDGKSASRGDLIELWTGKMRRGSDPAGAMPNTMTAVVQRAADRGNGECQWVPNSQSMWMRRIYCSWMPAKGWIEQGGTYPTWIRPIGAPAPPG